MVCSTLKFGNLTNISHFWKMTMSYSPWYFTEIGSTSYHLKVLPLSFQKIIIWITSTKVMAVQRCLIYYVYMIIIDAQSTILMLL